MGLKNIYILLFSITFHLGVSNFLLADTLSANFNEKHWQEEVNKFDFKQEELPEQTKEEFKPDSGFSLPSIPNLTEIVYIIIIIIVIVIVIIVIQKLVFQGNTNSKIKNEYITSELIEDELKNAPIDEWPLLTLLNKYKQENNTRHVIRIYYLMTLQSLNQVQYIQWEKNKTNDHYLMELVNRSEYTSFAQLSHIFNYVWYGEYLLESAQYVKACEAFENFIQPLRKQLLENE